MMHTEPEQESQRQQGERQMTPERAQSRLIRDIREFVSWSGKITDTWFFFFLSQSYREKVNRAWDDLYGVVNREPDAPLASFDDVFGAAHRYARALWEMNQRESGCLSTNKVPVSRILDRLETILSNYNRALLASACAASGSARELESLSVAAKDQCYEQEDYVRKLKQKLEDADVRISELREKLEKQEQELARLRVVSEYQLNKLHKLEKSYAAKDKELKGLMDRCHDLIMHNASQKTELDRIGGQLEMHQASMSEAFILKKKFLVFEEALVPMLLRSTVGLQNRTLEELQLILGVLRELKGIDESVITSIVYQERLSAIIRPQPWLAITDTVRSMEHRTIHNRQGSFAPVADDELDRGREASGRAAIEEGLEPLDIARNIVEDAAAERLEQATSEPPSPRPS